MLPAPDVNVIARRGEYQPAQSPQEQLVVDIWQEVLGLDNVGVTDGFFDLGGNSLLALRLFSKLQSAFDSNTELALVDLFSYTTIRTLVEYVNRGEQGFADEQQLRDRATKRRKAMGRNKSKRTRKLS